MGAHVEKDKINTVEKNLKHFTISKTIIIAKTIIWRSELCLQWDYVTSERKNTTFSS